MMRLFLSSLLCLCFSACDNSANENSRHDQSGSSQAFSRANNRPLIAASNYPLYFFSSQISGDSANMPQTVFPQIAGDPANWAPSAEQIQLIQSADLVLLNGAGYESWLDWVTLDRSYLIDTSAGFGGQLIELDQTLTHQHGPAGEHAHTGVAFTTWMDPHLAIEQAQAIASALQALVPEQAELFKSNLAMLQSMLTGLDKEMADTFSLLGNQAVLFSHPVYQYLQRRYGLNGVSLHWEPDVEPSASAWIALQKILAEHPAAIMMWEAEPLSSTTKRLQELGVRSIVFETAANRPDHGDYFEIQIGNSMRLRSALQND